MLNASEVLTNQTVSSKHTGSDAVWRRLNVSDSSQDASAAGWDTKTNPCVVKMVSIGTANHHTHMLQEGQAASVG
jgi:hypothetical protein